MYDRQDCSLARALEVIGERWTLLIVRDAFYGVQRFNDFHAHLDIPRAVLTERLNGLVEFGVLDKQADPDHAGRSIYALTDAGRDLWPVVHALRAWGERHRGVNSRDFTHAACGTELDDRGDCPACAVTPSPQDIVTARRPDAQPGRTDPIAVALLEPHRLLDPL